MHHIERHWAKRIGWLRAAVLGANDGIVSTASLIIGVGAAGASHSNIIIAGGAALVAGAMSMAAGEYVSVSSQADTEEADLDRERKELATDIESELKELTHIYVGRGLEQTLAKQVAQQLMEHDALAAHARDELGISLHNKAKPIQAAFVSAATFSTGSILPLLAALFVPQRAVIFTVVIASLVFLATLGGLGAYAGGASIKRAAARVTFWGAMAMAITAGVGALLGIAV